MNLNIWLPQALAADLTEAAHASRRTVQDLVRDAVVAYLHPAAPDPAPQLPPGARPAIDPFEAGNLRVALPDGVSALDVLARS